MTEWRDEKTLRELYVKQGMSSREVADELGCGKKAVLRWLNRHGIDTNTPNRERPPHYYIGDRGYFKWKHTRTDNQYHVREHRLLAVAKFGFDAVQGMEVHHENGCKLDNRMENINLRSKEDHARLHGKEREEHRKRAESGEYVKTSESKKL